MSEDIPRGSYRLTGTLVESRNSTGKYGPLTIADQVGHCVTIWVKFWKESDSGQVQALASIDVSAREIAAMLNPLDEAEPSAPV